jgi:hypothetical protein
MGSGSSKKSSKIAPAVTNERDSKKGVASVWLLSSSDEELLQQTMSQVRKNIENSTPMKDADSCMSYVRSLYDFHVILIASSEFTSKIFPEVCSLSQVVSFISFHAFDGHDRSNVSKNNHFASSGGRLIDIINDDLERIRSKEKSITVVIYEETINRLLGSFANIPIYGSYKKFLGRTINYSISLREPKMTFLRGRGPEVVATVIAETDGHTREVIVRAEVNIIVDEQNNEIHLDIQELKATDTFIIKDIDLSKYLQKFFGPIKFRGPMNMISYVTVNIPGGQKQKTLHVRPYRLGYEIYDHYIVLSSDVAFTVDPGPTVLCRHSTIT